MLVKNKIKKKAGQIIDAMIAKDAGKIGSGSGVSNDSAGTNEPDSANAHTEGTASEEGSTDGEDSDVNSPSMPVSEYVNQQNEIRAALVNSKALVGDYVELKNCKRCGSMIFKVSFLNFQMTKNGFLFRIKAAPSSTNRRSLMPISHHRSC